MASLFADADVRALLLASERAWSALVDEIDHYASVDDVQDETWEARDQLRSALDKFEVPMSESASLLPARVLRPNYAEPHDCPECGRWLTRTESGSLACFYAEDHRTGRDIYLSKQEERERD